jgi:hypothetical protein
MFHSTTLRPMRGLLGLSQSRLAKQLKKLYGVWRTQSDISRLERGGHDPRLQQALSQYFCSRGLDADPSGAIIYIPPHPGGDAKLG